MHDWSFASSFFDDEIVLYIENNDASCWKIKFEICYSMEYKTDANIRDVLKVKTRDILKVKTMKKSQLGYFVQSIVVSESNIPDFYEIHMDLTVMDIKLICKNITIEMKRKKLFFWEK